MQLPLELGPSSAALALQIAQNQWIFDLSFCRKTYLWSQTKIASWVHKCQQLVNTYNIFDSLHVWQKNTVSMDTVLRARACLRKAGFPGGGRCEDARGAGAGIGQRPQPIPGRPAYNLQAGTYLPNLPSARQPAGSRFKVSGGGQDLEWRSSLELQLGLQSVVHTMNTARTPCVRAAQCPCVHTLFTTASRPKQ